MSHYSTFTLLDQTEEKGTMSFPHGALTVASLPGFLTEFGALRTAVTGLTRGTLSKEKIVLDETVLSTAVPGDNLAQRENKFLVVYRDTTSGKTYTMTIPTADLAVVEFAPGGGDVIILNDAGPVAAFVAAFEAIARSPESDTHNVEVMQMRFVGRNS
jgi:hypothetical protein